MLIGANDQGPDAAQDNLIFDVTGPEFEQKVLHASMEAPVIVDFWAPWCGPCKQLGPVLEAAVMAAGGQVTMAKVNLDENQELAQALRIQSVPTVFAFFQGRPVDAFQGAKPESEVKAFVAQLVKLAKSSAPDAIDIPEALAMAAQALADEDFGAAQAIYAQVLSQDETNADAYAGLIRTYIAAGVNEQAQALIENAPPEIAKSSAFEAAKSALELAEASPSGSLEDLAIKVTRAPDDHEARFDLAMAEFTGGRKEEAIDNLIEIIRREREWEDEKARKQLLKFFEALGPSDPLSIKGRRKLSSVLFS